MNYGIVFTPLVPTIVLWIALAAIVAISALLAGRPRARRSGARRGAGADPAGTRQPLLHAGGTRAVVLGRRRRDRQEPEPEFRHAQPGDGEGAGSARRYAEEDQGAGSPRRRGRTGRRRDRRHQIVRRGVLGAVGCPGRSRRRRVPGHRRPRPRHSRQCRSARVPGAGACAGHRAQGRARPAHRDHRRAPLRHRRTAPDHHLPAGRPGRHRPARQDRRAPRRRGRQRAHDAERPDRQCRDRHQACRPEHRRDRGLAAGERTDAGQQPRCRLHRRRARQAARAAGLRRAAFRRAHLAQFVEVRRQRRPRALHDSAPAGEAGRYADQRIVADRVSDARTVPAEDTRVSSDHLRPLRPPGRAADRLFRQYRALCPRRRRGAGLGRAGLRLHHQHLADAAGYGAAGRAGRRHRKTVPCASERCRKTPSGDARPRRLRERAAALEPLLPYRRHAQCDHPARHDRRRRQAAAVAVALRRGPRRALVVGSHLAVGARL